MKWNKFKSQLKVGDWVGATKDFCGDTSRNSESGLYFAQIMSLADTAISFNGCIHSLSEDIYDTKEWMFVDKEGNVINKKNMNITEKFLLAFKKEPEKSFRKAGITNGDDLLTDEGQQVFLSWLLQKHGSDFKSEVVDGLLESEKDLE